MITRTLLMATFLSTAALTCASYAGANLSQLATQIGAENTKLDAKKREQTEANQRLEAARAKGDWSTVATEALTLTSLQSEIEAIEEAIAKLAGDIQRAVSGTSEAGTGATEEEKVADAAREVEKKEDGEAKILAGDAEGTRDGTAKKDEEKAKAAATDAAAAAGTTQAEATEDEEELKASLPTFEEYLKTDGHYDQIAGAIIDGIKGIGEGKMRGLLSKFGQSTPSSSFSYHSGRHQALLNLDHFKKQQLAELPNPAGKNKAWAYRGSAARFNVVFYNIWNGTDVGDVKGMAGYKADLIKEGKIKE